MRIKVLIKNKFFFSFFYANTLCCTPNRFSQIPLSSEPLRERFHIGGISAELIHKLRLHTAVFAELFHRELRLFKLLYQFVDVSDRSPRSLCDALAARGSDDKMVRPLFFSHRQDDRFLLFHAVRIEIAPLHLLCDARHHLHKLLHTAHFAHLPKLREHVVERKLVARHFLLQLFRFFAVDRFLRLFDERLAMRSG